MSSERANPALGVSPSESHKGRVKRTRVGRACDTCRNKRVKCDGRQPACIPCSNYGIHCTYVEKPKGKPKTLNSRLGSSVRGRLARVEALLNVRDISPMDTSRDAYRRQQRPRDRRAEETLETHSARQIDSPGQSDIDSQNRDDDPSSFDNDQFGAVDCMTAQGAKVGSDRFSRTMKGTGSLVVNQQGDLQYLGPSSGFSVLSQATELLNDGKTIHQQLHMSEFEPSAKEAQAGTDISLPPKDIADKYIEAYFTNSPFPTFHRSTFEKRANLMYSTHPPLEKCFRASWSMVLAFGSHYTGASSSSTPLQETEGWAYFTLAQDKLPDLLQGSNLSALQALLLIVQYLQFTSRASRWMLMGACAQMAQALGLHRDSHALNLSPIVREERIKVFWVCYVMDKTISMATGRSSALHDFDCDVPLPSSDEPWTCEDGDGNDNNRLTGALNRLHDFFLCSIRLAQIISRVYRKLYSVRSVARHTIDSLADAVGDLDEELTSWRNNLPEEYRPEHDVEWKADILHRHILQLHLGYYNCLYNIHRAVFTLPFKPTTGSYFTPDRPLYLLRRNRIYGSEALAIGAARACLRLILTLAKRFPGFIDLRIWLVAYYPFSSIIALFIAIMRNPRQPSAEVDLQLIAAAVQLFNKIYVRSDLAEKMNALTCRFEAEATTALQSGTQKKEGNKVIDNAPAITPNSFSYSTNSHTGEHNHTGFGTNHENHRSRGNARNQHQSNCVLPDGWSNLDLMATDFGDGDYMDEVQPSTPYSLRGSSQDAPDLWQAPISFEWDQWAAYVARFPGESLDLNGT